MKLDNSPFVLCSVPPLGLPLYDPVRQSCQGKRCMVRHQPFGPTFNE